MTCRRQTTVSTMLFLGNYRKKGCLESGTSLSVTRPIRIATRRDGDGAWRSGDVVRPPGIRPGRSPKASINVFPGQRASPMFRRCFTLVAVFGGSLCLIAPQCRADYDLLAADFNNNVIVRITQSGSQSIFASTGIDAPIGLAVNQTTGNVYVVNNGASPADPLANTISEFSATGNLIQTFGAAQLNSPFGIAINAAGNLFVSTQGNNGTNTTGQIQEFSSTGTFLGTFATLAKNSFPYGTTFDGGGNLYVSSFQNNNVIKFSSAGTILNTITSNLDGPTGLSIGPNGDLFVSNFGKVSPFVDKITEYTPSGSFVQTFAASNMGAGVSGPIGLAFGNTTGDLYVANSFDGTIERFAPNGTDLGILATLPNSGSPYGIAFEPVPEPASLGLMALGMVGAMAYTHRRGRRNAAVVDRT